jgi:hypothetical protein
MVVGAEFSARGFCVFVCHFLQRRNCRRRHTERGRCGKPPARWIKRRPNSGILEAMRSLGVGTFLPGDLGARRAAINKSSARSQRAARTPQNFTAHRRGSGSSKLGLIWGIVCYIVHILRIACLCFCVCVLCVYLTFALRFRHFFSGYLVVGEERPFSIRFAARRNSAVLPGLKPNC